MPYGIPNKVYNAPDFSGLGVKYIPKNVVDGSNVLTQDVFGTGHTIYVIEFDYVLTSGITIPSDCVLSFKGGSISGGSITLDKTYIEGEAVFNGTVISGSCTNEVLTPSMFGARPSLVEDESNKVNHTIGFKNLANVLNDANTVSKLVIIPSGHYSINESILFMPSCEVHGYGDSTVIDCYDGAGALGFGYTNSGNNYYNSCQTLNCTLTEDANKFDNYITVDSTSELNVDDRIILIDTNDYSFNKSRKYYRMCEFAKVIKIEGNKLYLANKLYGYYPVDFGEDYSTSFSPTPSHRTVISKFSPNQYIITDLSIISHEHSNPTPSSYYTLVVCGFEDSLFRNVHIENYGNQVAWCLKLAINYSVDGCVVRNYATYTTDAYGLVINNSQDFNVRNSKFSAPSHALATGGGSSLYDTINRNFIYEKLYFENNKNNLNVSSTSKIDLDVHGDSEYYKFLNIISPSTICDCGGYNVTIEDCKFYNISLSFNESDITIRNCEIFTDSTSFLAWNEASTHDLSNNSVVIEGCNIHGHITINYQSSTYLYENLVFRNNISGGLELRNGKVNNVIIENNSFKEGGSFSTTNISGRNISIKHNTFMDGVLRFVSQDKGICVITDNFINNDNEYGSIDTQTVLFSGLDGYFSNNIVLRNFSNYHTPLFVTHGEMKVNNNIFRISSDNLNTPIVASKDASVIFINNMHNSTSHTIFRFEEGALSATSFGFCDYYKDLSVASANKMSIKSALGNTFYDEENNRLAYRSIGHGGDYLKNFVFSGGTYIAENIFEPSLFYGTNTGSWGNHELYLSKYNDESDPNFEDGLLLIHSFSYPMKFFQAPLTASEYPYYCVRSNKSNFAVNIWPSRTASEYDGAIYRVNRAGTTAERPKGYEIYVGFMYVDTDLGKPIFCKSISGPRLLVTWVDATGATV